MKKRGKAQQPSYDPYSTSGVDGSGEWAELLPVKVISVPDPIEDDIGTVIQRGMLVLELGCGVGDLSLRIAKLVGAAGLVVGVDESAEYIRLAERRAIVAGQCYWTRFIAADLNTFIPNEHALIPHELYDAVVVARAHMLQRERATLLRASEWLRPDGVIIITDGEPDVSIGNRSSIRGKSCSRGLNRE
jgi:SAM-dependent methyltransferase